MTLAPQSASWRTQVGPDRTRVKSSTVKRVSAFEARGKGIAGASNAGFPLALAAGGIFAGRKGNHRTGRARTSLI
jgi:hypothetical protein